MEHTSETVTTQHRAGLDDENLIEQLRSAMATISKAAPGPNWTRIAVGTEIAPRPPHRSQRAELPHWAPTLGE